jgi:hypothetical protein
VAGVAHRRCSFILLALVDVQQFLAASLLCGVARVVDVVQLNLSASHGVLQKSSLFCVRDISLVILSMEGFPEYFTYETVANIRDKCCQRQANEAIYYELIYRKAMNAVVHHETSVSFFFGEELEYASKWLIVYQLCKRFPGRVIAKVDNTENVWKEVSDSIDKKIVKQYKIILI